MKILFNININKNTNLVAFAKPVETNAGRIIFMSIYILSFKIFYLLTEQQKGVKKFN